MITKCQTIIVHLHSLSEHCIYVIFYNLTLANLANFIDF